MTEQKINAKDARPGMQVKVAGVWWQITGLMPKVVSRAGRTFAVQAKRARNDGYTTGAAPRMIWIDHGPIAVRAGVPAETSIVNPDRKTVRVVLRPRHAGDERPYLASDGSRYTRYETASGRMVAGLAEAFEKGWTW